VEERPITEPRRSIIVVERPDRWQDTVLAAVLESLDTETPTHTCITTPSGRACRVTVWFETGGKA
jgi:hypothetical protein